MSSDQLLVVGTEAFDAWHVAAHLDDEARLNSLPGLRPTLLRRQPSPGGPSHLRHSIHELDSAGRRDAVLVVAPHEMDEQTLQRLSDARHRGAILLGVCRGDHELASVTHECVAVPFPSTSRSDIDQEFDAATHVLAVSAGTARPH